MPQIVLFTQPGCLSCEFLRIYLEARELPFEERDISKDPEARRAMTETHGSNETPTMLIATADGSPGFWRRELRGARSAIFRSLRRAP